MQQKELEDLGEMLLKKLLTCGFLKFYSTHRLQLLFGTSSDYMLQPVKGQLTTLCKSHSITPNYQNSCCFLIN